MSCKQIFILITIIALALNVGARGHGSTEDLQKLLARSKANDCFNNYMRHTQVLTMKSEKKYNACDQGCENEKSNIEAAALEKRNNLASSAGLSCSTLQHCNDLPTAVEALNCLAEASSNGARTMYTVNTKASKYLVDIKEAHRLADNNKYKCTNETKDHFESEVADVNVHLTECMMGTNDEWVIPEDSTESEDSN